LKVLVLNAGSSSLKYRLIDVTDIENMKLMAKGICDRVGSEASQHVCSIDENELRISIPMENHDEAMQVVLDTLSSGPLKVLDSLDEIDAVGHRVVQGGKYFSHSVIIDDDVIKKIAELSELAPLHNKAALSGIHACQKHMPGVPMVAAFDTAFFQTLLPKAYMYPLPYDLCKKYNIRKYGAHGISHRYIAERAAEFLGKPLQDLKMITCHLGNGCSVTAIDHGQAVDTSMGMTPLDGLMMGTRCGSIDPAIVTFLEEHEHLSPEEMDDLMNKKSGILGVTGISNDLRSIGDAADQGDARSQLAYEMYAYSVKRYIGQYIAVLGGVDVIVLAAGVGENSKRMRRLIFEGLETIGIIIDEKRNNATQGEREISSDDSNVRVLIIPTDEEFMIARDTYELVEEREEQKAHAHEEEVSSVHNK